MDASRARRSRSCRKTTPMTTAKTMLVSRRADTRAMGASVSAQMMSEGDPDHVAIRATCGAGTKGIGYCVRADKATRDKGQVDRSRLPKASRTARQGEACNAQRDKNHRYLAGFTDLFAEKGRRDDRNDERRDATCERIDVAEIADAIGPVQEDHVAYAQHSACAQIRPTFASRREDKWH